MTVIYVCVDETQEEATARTFAALTKRRELAGYVGDGFIFKGRRCIGGGGSGDVVLFVSSAKSAAQAKAEAEQRLAADRRSILRARAVREAVNDRDLYRLLALYGVT